MSLPRLMDCKAIMDELGVKRNVAEEMMRHVPKVIVPGKRKVFVKKSDVESLLEEMTVDQKVERGLRSA